MNFSFFTINALQKKACFVLVFLFISFALYSQNNANGKISGKITDSIQGSAMEYVTISLLTEDKGTVINGTTSDIKGNFKISNIPDGTYKVIFDFLGYKRVEKHNIVISKANQSVNFKEIKMSVKQNNLKEATISADKILIENKIDKMVYNAEKDVTSQTGVAADILKKVPEVSVDVDGNVELQGNANIRFLINGKPSILFGSNITDVLHSIPASQIQSIEVITSPGAKYDAEGTGGIINIILKQNNASGFNGNLSLSAGTRLQNGSLNLNYRKNNLGVNLFFSGNAQLSSSTKNSMNRIAQDTTGSIRLLQDGVSDFNRNGFQSGISLDWDLNKKNNLTVNFNYDYFGNNSTGNSTNQTLSLNPFGLQLSDITDALTTANAFNEHSYNAGLTYKKKFKKEDQELEFSINTSNGNQFSSYNQSQKHVLSEEIFNSSYGNNPGIENETNIKLNYTHPVSENFIIEAGAKAEFDEIKSNSDVFLLNTSNNLFEYSALQSSSVYYKRAVYAAYFSSTFKLFKLLDIKAGIRDEYTKAKANYSDAGFVSMKPYNTIVPSLVLAHTFSNKQTLKISYSHRIERPDYGDMNPFVNQSDPKNIRMGNSGLRPEIGNKIELGYSHSFKSGANINLTLFYRGNIDDIQSYAQYFSQYKIGDSVYNDVSVSTRMNMGKEDNYGLSFFGSLPIVEKINIRANATFIDRYIYTGLASGGDVHGYILRTNLNASIQISKTLIVELQGNFNSPRINAQGTYPSFTSYNFAFRKQLFNKKASIAFTATNFLDKYVNQKTELNGENFTLSNLRQMPYRSFGINFSLKFGKMKFNKEREPEEMNGGNPPGFEN